MAPIFIILILASSARALTIEEAMVFENEQELRITVLVRDLQTPNLSLGWPIPSGRILQLPRLSNQSDALANSSELALTVFVTGREPSSFSFLVQFPCRENQNHVFPTARPSTNESTHTMRVLLPEGWTAAEFSRGCRKTYDAKVGRIALEWQDIGQGSCEAVLVRPGGEAEIRWRLSWMIIRGYVLTGLLVALILAAAILLRRFTH